MARELIIRPPDHVEVNYRESINAGILVIHGYIATLLGKPLSDKLIYPVMDKVQQFIKKWLDTGIDEAGVYHPKRAGRGYKAARSAVYGTEKYHRVKLVRGIKRLYKEDVSRLITKKNNKELTDASIRQNVSLLLSVTQQQQNYIERELLEEWRNPGINKVPLRDRLQVIERRGRNRGALIAENEIGNLHGDLQMTRFARLGLNEYVWRTSQDERVRTAPVSHRALNGQVFRVGEPTSAEDGLPPGKPTRCRCVAIPRFVVK